MNLAHLVLIIAATMYFVARMESLEAQEDYELDCMIRESREPKPRYTRNPYRFGSVGYQPLRRCRHGAGRV